MRDAIRWRQFAVFVAGGVLSTAADIGVMQLLLQGGAHHMVAASVAFCAGLLINYAFHTRITFATAPSRANVARYMAVVGMNYLITIACVALAVSLVDNPLVGKILSLPLVAVNGYLLSRYWIFK